MRVGGRLEESSLPYNVKHPILLPSKSISALQDIHNCFTARLVYYIHEKNAHAGANWCLHHLCQNGYWILGGKRKVASIIKRCIKCRKAIGRQMTQKMAPLPQFRTSMSEAWTHCGTDTAGPIYLNSGNEDQVKCYIMVFIDLVTRAVHLELIKSLHTEEMILAIRRMMARRGIIQHMHSDQHKSFLRGKKEIETLFISQEKASEIAQKLQFTWSFTTERASWHGGSWERQIRVIKETLRKILGKRCLRTWVMYTILTEVEAFINDRPLATVPNSSTTDIIPITPSMLISGRQLKQLPKPASNLKESTILERWKERQSLLDQTWSKWQKEYLFSLTCFQKWENSDDIIKIGDIVLIATENQPRGSWPLAKVLSLQSERGKEFIRSLTLQLSNRKQLKRPIQHLVKLECQ